MRKISIVIPCFNEEENIPLIFNKLKEFQNYKNIEVILVNNGSTDKTYDKIKEFHKNFSFIRLVNLPFNQGYGGGIISGLKIAKGEILAWTHADMQTDPLDILKGLKFFENNKKNISVKGKRYGRSLFDNFFTIGMSFFETFLLRKILWDINAQPTMFYKSFFDTWSNPPSDFSLDLYAYFLAKKRKFHCYRFRVFFDKRRFGESKWNTSFSSKLKFIKRTLVYSFNLNKHIK